MLPANVFTAFAAGETSTAEGTDIGESDVFDALGIDTSEIPEEVDLDSTDNPYGRNTFIRNPVYEVLVQDSQRGHLFGENKPLNLGPDDVLSQGKTDAATTPGGYADGVSKTVAGHFNNKTDASKSNYATVVISGTGNNAAAYLYFSSKSGQNNPNNRITLVELGKVGFYPMLELPEYYSNLEGMMHNYVQIAAGDYDGDGVDEVAVYVPEYKNHRIVIYDLQIDDIYRDTNADTYFTNASQWHVIWSQKIRNSASGNMFGDEYDGVNMVSFATGDFNQDGIDDLSVSYGLFLPMADSVLTNASAFQVFFGDRMTLFYNSTVIEPEEKTVRASVAARDLTGDGVPELVIGGNLISDIEKKDLVNFTHFNSRYLAIYKFNHDTKKFDLLTGQNFNLFEKDDQGNYTYSFIANHRVRSDGKTVELFYSLPLLKANLAVGYFNGPMDIPYIYLDSLIFQYTDQGLKLVYSMEGQRTEETQNQGFYFTRYLEGNNQETGDFTKPRFYMEYDVVIGDMAGSGKETAVVLLNAPKFPKHNYNTYFMWINDLLNKSRPENYDDANLPEMVMALFLSVDPDAAGDSSSDSGGGIQDGYFIAGDYNKQYNPGTRRDPKGSHSGEIYGLPLNRCASIVLCDTDQDTTYLSYTGQHEVRYSDPKVLAVLASPPYFKDLDRDDLSGSMMEAETAFSSEKESGSGSSKAVNVTAGVYLAGKIGSENAWFEYETTATYGFTKEAAENSTKGFSVTYSTLAGQDTVVLYSIPVEIYYYNAYAPVPDSSGNIARYDKQTVSVNFPHKPAVKTIELEKYKKLAKDYSLPVISDDVITSTPGDPFSYPQSASGFKDAIVYSGDWSGVDYGNASSSQEITITKEYEETVTHAVDVEFKAGGGGEYRLWGAKCETSGGLVGGVGGEWSTVTFSSVGSTYSGTIFDLPAEAEPYGYYFAWKHRRSSGA